MDAQVLTRLAAWATKTAMMFQFNDPATATFSRDQRHALRSVEAPPMDTEVWVARYAGQEVFRTMHSGYSVENVPEGADPIAALASYEPTGEVWGRIGLTRLAVGSLAMLITSTSPPPERKTLTDVFPEVADRWVRIWPNPPQRLKWPLDGPGIGDDDLRSLAFLRVPAGGIARQGPDRKRRHHPERIGERRPHVRW